MTNREHWERIDETAKSSTSTDYHGSAVTMADVCRALTNMRDRIAAVNEARQAARNPLDESNHQNRQLADGTPLAYSFRGHWHTPDVICRLNCTSSPDYDPDSEYTLALWDKEQGPLTFAPATQDAEQQDTGDAVEVDAAARPSGALLCPECGHNIDWHIDEAVVGETCLPASCKCQLRPSDIARRLVAKATSDVDADAGEPEQQSPEDLHLAILRETVADLREMSIPNVSTGGWRRGWRAGVDLCTQVLAEIADEYAAEVIGKKEEATS